MPRLANPARFSRTHEEFDSLALLCVQEYSDEFCAALAAAADSDENSARMRELEESIGQVLADLEWRCVEFSEAELDVLSRIFAQASSAVRDRRIFGVQPRTKENANRYAEAMAGRNDLTDDERRQYADDLRHLRDAYGWGLRCVDPKSTKTISCTVTLDDASNKQGKRFRVRETGGKQAVIRMSRSAPLFQFG